jgi:hypothetical protein
MMALEFLDRHGMSNNLNLQANFVKLQNKDKSLGGAGCFGAKGLRRNNLANWIHNRSP